MKIGYYPGCSLHGTAVEYEESLKAIAAAFDIQLEEIQDWNCCGATAAHSLNHMLSLSLPARVLALAEQQGFDEVLVPCAACFSRLASTRHEIMLDEKLKVKIPEILELPYTGKTKPINIIEFINRHITPKLKESVKKQFNKKVACYYGCLLVRPPKIAGEERYEDPISMEGIMSKIGATPLDWGFKTECCGAGLSVSKTEIVARLSGNILQDAVDRGAEAIIVACPMCQSNLDMRRSDIEAHMNKKFDIPILFITQALGMALGMDKDEVGTKRHIVPVNLTFDTVAPKPAPVAKPVPAGEEA
jgi:heterodisulfide reductase subunit B